MGSFFEETFRAYRSTQRSFSTMSMYSGGFLVRVEAPPATADAGVEAVSPEYFGLAGATLAAGRFFSANDDSTTPTAVISERLCQKIFGTCEGAVGKILRLNAMPTTIVGITAANFYGLEFDGAIDVFVPIGLLRTLSGSTGPVRSLNLVGRLAPGVSLDAARAEVAARWASIQAATLPGTLPAEKQEALRTQRIGMSSLAHGFSGLREQYASSLVDLAILAGVLLAMVGCNLAALMLARSLSRRHQMAVRAALGASRGQIVRHVLMESLLLAAAGFLVSLPLAWWATRAVSSMLMVARPTPLLPRLVPTAGVVAIGASITLGLGLLIALVPAIHASTQRLSDHLQAGRTIATSAGRSGQLLTVAEVALSLVLVVAAGLFSMSLRHLRRNDSSLHPKQVFFARLARTPGDHTPVTATYLHQLVEDLSTISGVQNAALSLYYPGFLGFPGPLPESGYSRGDSATGGEAPALTEWVSPGFFDLFTIPRRRGRDFTWSDGADEPAVAILNETLAVALFPEGDAIGRSLRLPSQQDAEPLRVVGIVADAPIGRIQDPNVPVVFRPLLQDLSRAQFPLAHVRVAGDIAGVRKQFTAAVQSENRHFVRGVFRLDEWVDFALLQERMVAELSAFAASMTLLLACIGVYSLLSYAVAARRREIAIRMALGATALGIVGMIAREGLAIAIGGLGIGALAAFTLTRLVRSQLYEIAPNDPTVAIGAAAVLLAVILASSCLPARRASRVDPIAALRRE